MYCVLLFIKKKGKKKKTPMHGTWMNLNNIVSGQTKNTDTKGYTVDDLISVIFWKKADL